MHNEWLTHSTLRLTLGNNSLFWLQRENERMKVLTHFYLNWQDVWTVTAKIKSRIYEPPWNDKKKTFGCGWCFVCDSVWANECLTLVPVRGQTVAFHWKSKPIYSDKSRVSQLSQHDITAPEPSFIRFINVQLRPYSFYFVWNAKLIRFYLKSRLRET